MIHLPILRHGEPYRSLDVARVPHHRTRELFVEVSQANVGLIRRDLRNQEAARAALAKFSTAELVDICRHAGDHFVYGKLPLGDVMQTPEDYIQQVSATTGLPYVLARRNMQKIRSMFAQMEQVLNGLTRNLDWDLLDSGFGDFDGKQLSFYPRTQSLGVVLPNNSPGVHSLWVPAVALKTPLVLKPGGAEPWTPYRVVQALIRAGAPPDAFGYYPTDHAGAGEILRVCGRSILFGDTATTAAWRNDPRIELHGPGYSKVVLGPDAAPEWRRHLDVVEASVLENSGRSCVNASGIWVAGHARELAEALADRLAGVQPRATEDEHAQLAPFVDRRVAERISAAIDEGLASGGAEDLTARHRSAGRLVTWQGASYLRPTVVLCDSPDHPLANREFLFPFASVVTVAPDEIPERLGPSLVVSAITGDPDIRRRLLASPLVQRLNLGPIATPRIRWDQPHEGNLFEHLYARRALQTVDA